LSEADDALREMAANRGCKLVKSRRRKPGGDFGRYGLKDAATGKEVLGFGAKGFTATREEVQAYLRGGLTASWKRSLITAVPDAPAPAARGRAKAGKAKPAARKPGPAAEPAPPARASRPAKPTKPAKAATPRKAARRQAPPPEPVVREARPKDAAAVAALVAALGYDVGEAEVRRGIARLRKSGEPPLVLELGDVAGCLTWHVTDVLHRPRPVGRITMMVVAEGARGRGLGARLLAEAEQRLRDMGCGLVEVTSNVKRMRAHGFYQREGYERTSYRFAKPLGD
jgi:GNAT superfamily N-acetyltransferase